MRSSIHRRWGFTLLELLVALGVIAILAVILMPVLGNVSKRTKTFRCATRLRQTGVLLQNYIADSNNIFFVYFGGSDGLEPEGVNLWTRKLILKNYINPDQFLTTFQCPDGLTQYPPYVGTKWFYESYGINGFDARASITGETKNGNSTRWVTIRTTQIDNPGAFILVADSMSATGHQVSVIKNQFGLNPIALRHQKRGNVFFLDGHIESLTEGDCHKLGLPQELYAIEEER